MLWSEASPVQREAALNKIESTTDEVVRCLWDDAEQRAAKGDRWLINKLRGCRTREGREQREQLAFEWFGDLQQPQPTERRIDRPPERVSVYESWGLPESERPTYPIKDWPGGRLPTFESLMGDEAPAAPAAEPSLVRPRPLPADVNLFAFASIQKAVRLFAEDESLNTVAGDTIFSPHDATRIRRLWESHYLTLNDERVLRIDPRVGRVGKQYALRVWDERSGRWLDPAKGGFTPG